MRAGPILGLTCAAILAVILTLGLWPFHVPANQVAWLRGRPGLAFDGRGSVYSSGALPAPKASESGVSVEIWLQPRNIWDSSTLLGFCSPENPLQLLVRQSGTDLEIESGHDRRERSATAKLYVNDAFRKERPSFLTITSGANGTSVYIDGILAKATERFRLSTRQFAGRLVVGDAPGQTDSWRGQFFGLAIYHSELTPLDAARHYETWTREGRPAAARDPRMVALYLFEERVGNTVRNAAGQGLDLTIPERYTVVEKIFLEPFWREFSLSRSYLSAAVKNTVGFMPFGLCFYAWLTALRLKRAALATVLLGTAASVTIEILQAYLPTRDSGTTDIFTNTLGTWMGVACCRAAVPVLARIFPETFPVASPHRLEHAARTWGERD
jgi:VanZ like family/Concanavalin A-like lectin/glucanases superfamily